MSVANYALAAVRKGQIAVRGKKRIEFDLNRPCNQPTSAGSQNFGERIIDFVLSVGERRRYSRSWRNAPSWGFGWFGHQPRTPPSSPRHPVSSIALTIPGLFNAL